MSSKKWILVFLLTVFFIGACLAAFNVLTDPFGAFGDPVMQWWSYDETYNPRVAKISYLEQNHEKYDSYILGCSSTSSLPVEAFNAVYGANFYNMVMYDADMLDCENIAAYLLENYEVRNLVLNVYIDNGVIYHEESNPLTKNQHYLTDPEISLWSHLRRYLFLDPKYGKAKLDARKNDRYLNQSFDVFDEETGCYDKTARDAEPINTRKAYFKAYPALENYPSYPQYGLYQTENCMKSVAAIKEMCREKDVNLVVIAGPVYCEYLKSFAPERLRHFYNSLGAVTDFWDFSYTSASREPRYFYDCTHFRNCVGEMIAAKLDGSEELWMPDDFGTFVTSADSAAHFEKLYGDDGLLVTSGYERSDGKELEQEVTIYTYHNLAEDGDGGSTIAAAAFEEDLKTVAAEGYTTVFFCDIIDYVVKGSPLPEKPLLITFDDGYLSNYELAFPLLQKYGMKATVFTVGSSVGCSNYKNSGYAMIPHFSWEQAREMEASGLVQIQSHTWDMHQWPPFEKEGAVVRENIAQLAGEDDWDYAALIEDDYETISDAFLENLGHGISVVSYPSGVCGTLGQAVLQLCGMKASVGTSDGTATLVKGLPQSLLSMNRITRK